MSSFKVGVALSATLSLWLLLFGLPANAYNHGFNDVNANHAYGVSGFNGMGLDPTSVSRYQALGITIEPGAVAPPYYGQARHLSHAGASPGIPRESTPHSTSDADRFMVMLNETCAFVDAKGQRVITAHFESANNFHEGLASVAVAEADSPMRWGLIDRAGRWVVQPQYEAMGDMVQGLIRVMHQGKWGYMNARGAWVIPPRFDMAYDFTEGYARVSQDGHWGLVTPTGDWALLPEYADMADYGNGYVPVYSDKVNRWLFMSLDRQRMMVTKVEQTLGFNDGYAPIKMHGGWGLMNTVGTLTIPNRYREVGSLSEGLVPVQDGSGLWGYMTPQGKWVIAPSFEQAESFKGGRAWVLLQGEPQYIGHSGQVVMPAVLKEMPDASATSSPQERVPENTEEKTPNVEDVVWTPPSEA